MTQYVIVETLTTKVGNEEYDAVSYNVDYYDVKRFDDGELTMRQSKYAEKSPKQKRWQKTHSLMTVTISLGRMC